MVCMLRMKVISNGNYPYVLYPMVTWKMEGEGNGNGAGEEAGSSLYSSITRCCSQFHLPRKERVERVLCVRLDYRD